MQYYDIIVFYLDGTKEEYCGGYDVRERGDCFWHI